MKLNDYISEDNTPRENEIECWGVPVASTYQKGDFKKMLEIPKHIKDIEGLLGVHPVGVCEVFLFDNINSAKICWNRLKGLGYEIRIRNEIPKLFIDKKYLEDRK